MAAKNAQAADDPGPFLTIRQFVEKHPEFTFNQIRWAIHKAEESGLAATGAIKRRNLSGGRKRTHIRLSESGFLAWWATS